MLSTTLNKGRNQLVKALRPCRPGSGDPLSGGGAGRWRLRQGGGQRQGLEKQDGRICHAGPFAAGRAGVCFWEGWDIIGGWKMETACPSSFSGLQGDLDGRSLCCRCKQTPFVAVLGSKKCCLDSKLSASSTKDPAISQSGIHAGSEAMWRRTELLKGGIVSGTETLEVI
jgi:hypothetical protein